MGRTIKLLLYYFAYQLAFMGVFLCGYMIFHHTTELPQSTDSTYITLILLAQVLSTAAVGIHLIVGNMYHSTERLGRIIIPVKF